MTIIKEEGVYAGEFLISECDEGAIGRDAVVIASGQGVLVAGSVLGKITLSGKFAAYDNSETNGTEVAAGILYSQVDATSADVNSVAITRLAEVKASLLSFKLDQDSTAQAAALADLKLANIIAR